MIKSPLLSHPLNTVSLLLKVSQMSTESSHLEGLVGVEIQREARVWEEKVQAPKVEQVVSADLLGKGLDGAWVGHWVQQHHLDRACNSCYCLWSWRPARASDRGSKRSL